MLDVFEEKDEHKQCRYLGSRQQGMLWHGSGCHFGSFDSFACLFFFSFRRIRSGYSGSAAVLRGRDCTVSFYRIRARCRLQSKLEPDRELRGRLAELEGSLCSAKIMLKIL